MNSGIILFARMDSSRLPGKSLMDIGGRSLLRRVLDRCGLIDGDTPIVVATSDSAADDAIADFARIEKVMLYRGALKDVASRALGCAERFGFDRFARICGDRPFFDPEVVGRLFDMHERERADLATNVMEKTFPAGATAEIVSTEALARSIMASDASEDREHMTRYFYSHPDRFRIINLRSSNPADAEVSLAVDTPADLEKARHIVEFLQGRELRAPLEEIVALARKWEHAHRTPPLSRSPALGSVGR
jgi:spore coat polysaccharide biosynthesis protein SpsF